MNAERKYTDRDVRENESLYTDVVDYLDAYEGEFDFLIDCKMRVAQDLDLTVGMVRGVLNCMRVDPRVHNLPDPLPPDEAKVIKMPKHGGRVCYDEPDNESDYISWHLLKKCENTDFHPQHGGVTYKKSSNFDGFATCQGVYELNRSDFIIDAKVKVPYVAGKTGALIHKVRVTDEWSDADAWYVWHVKAHEYGYREPRYHRYNWVTLEDAVIEGIPVPSLFVRVACKYPRILEDPILLPEDRLEEAQQTRRGNAGEPRTLCPRCFAS